MSNLLLTSDEWNAVGLSIKVAVACVIVSAIPGVLCGWFLARRSFRGKTLVDAVVHLPLVVPPVVTGYLLLIVLGSGSGVGRWLEGLGLDVAFTWYAAVIASAVMGFPLLVRSVRLAVEMVEPRLERAAQTLGASPLRVLLTITLPLALPGIATGLLLAFARSLGEFGATITFAGNIAGETRTVPIAIFSYTQSPGGEGAAMRLVVVSIVLSLLALLLSELLAQRMARRLGRG